MNWDDVISVTIYLVVLAAICAGGFLAYKSITASGVVEYCYVEQVQDEFLLKGAIDWRDDRTIFRGGTIDEALHMKGRLPVCKGR